MEEGGKGEKSNDKCRAWKANVTVTMNDREVNIDEIVILWPSNGFFSVTITEKELMKLLFSASQISSSSVVVTKKELMETVILRQLNRHYDQKSLYGITTVFFMSEVFSCTLVNGLINGQDKHNDNEKGAKPRHMTIILIHKSSNCCIFFYIWRTGGYILL